MTTVAKVESDFPKLSFGPSTWEDFTMGTRREWLVTNGLGGYASSSIIGANTRRYHGLLVAPIQSSTSRQVLLSKLQEEVGWGDHIYQISTNQYRDSLHPNGFRYLVSFTQNPFPTWTFQMDGIVLKKWLFMRHGQNSTVVGYELLEAPHPTDLHLQLLITQRNLHNLLRAEPGKFEQEKTNQGAQIYSNSNAPFLYVATDKGDYFPDSEWYYNFQYIREKERGLDFEEDLYHVGTFSIRLSPGETVFFNASTLPISSVDGKTWQQEETHRLKQILQHLPVHEPELQTLAMAADSFIVKRHDGIGVIAGYPWLNEWGRDTFISFPAFFLLFGRFEEGKQLLRRFASRIRRGLLPNCVHELELEQPKNSDPPGSQTFLSENETLTTDHYTTYNSVDAPLWFFYALYKYHQYTSDSEFIKEMLPTLEQIVQAYLHGTDFTIGVAEDSLVYVQDPETQLTWMDARIGHWVVTTRSGGCVEVNALWYNALKILEMFSTSDNKIKYAELAKKTLASFSEKFWNPQQQGLYDRITNATNEGPDDSIRPNQLFAISLPFRLLSREQEKKVLELVTSHLYTPYGLRTLACEHPQYQGIYQGDRWLRNRALHQGTVWPWLLGPYATALIKVEGESGRQRVRALFPPLFAHLFDAGIGTISEIFWGDFPHQATGCIAKAWSVAEILRAYVEDAHGIGPN